MKFVSVADFGEGLSDSWVVEHFKNERFRIRLLESLVESIARDTHEI